MRGGPRGVAQGRRGGWEEEFMVARLWRCGATLGAASARQGFEMGGDATVGREQRHLQSRVEEGGKVGVRGLWFKLG